MRYMETIFECQLAHDANGKKACPGDQMLDRSSPAVPVDIPSAITSLGHP
jgi:hypothetical protein